VLGVLLELRKWQSNGASRISPKGPLNVGDGRVFIEVLGVEL
jgi:hypothetical protein